MIETQQALEVLEINSLNLKKNGEGLQNIRDWNYYGIFLPPFPRSDFLDGAVGRICLQWGRHGRCGFYPWVAMIPGEGTGKSLQYSCLEISMDRRA